MSLSGKTMFISGASRGIGLAIAKRAAADGANIALIAKTAEPHPKLEGTVYTAAKELEEAGGQALPIVGDIRDGDSVASAVAAAVEQFGGIDICVNNASAINLGSITEVPLKRFDLMNGIQVRGTYAVSQACIPHMVGRENPHILTLSPPIRLEPEWLKPTAYMMAKYGMSLCALAMAEELRDEGIASNTLWPRTLVATAAVKNLLGGDEAMGRARKPDVYADAAYAVLNKPAREYTGKALLCEDVLLESGRHRSVGLRLRARRRPWRRPVGRHPQPAGLQSALVAAGFRCPKQPVDVGIDRRQRLIGRVVPDEQVRNQAVDGAEQGGALRLGVDVCDEFTAHLCGLYLLGEQRVGAVPCPPDERSQVSVAHGAAEKRQPDPCPHAFLLGQRQRLHRDGADHRPWRSRVSGVGEEPMHALLGEFDEVLARVEHHLLLAGEMVLHQPHRYAGLGCDAA